MTRPHKWSKAIRDERVPYDKRTQDYIGGVIRRKLSKAQKKLAHQLPTKLVFKEHKLRAVLDLPEQK